MTVFSPVTVAISCSAVTVRPSEEEQRIQKYLHEWELEFASHTAKFVDEVIMQWNNQEQNDAP